MRREFIQAIAVFAIALGAGMFAFGRHLDPPLDAANPAALQRAMNYDKASHAAASVATGVGVGLMTFGALSLVIPWLNDVVAGRHERSSARTM